MVQAGRELRLLADAFACTAERRKVQVMAESVNLGCIEMDDFFQLCAELFYVSMELFCLLPVTQFLAMSKNRGAE